MKYCIIVDSSTGIKNGEIKDVYCVPLMISENINGVEKNYRELMDIDSLQIIEKIKAKSDLKTSQTPIGEMIEILNQLKEQYDKIFVLPISSGISGTYKTWLMAKEDFEDKEIIVLNGKDFGFGNKAIIDLVSKMIKENKSIAEIEQAIEDRSNKRAGILVVSDLTQLKKGGRVSTLKAAIAKALGLNILITFDGALDFFDKTTSIDKAIDKALAEIDKRINYTKNKIKNAFFYTTFIDENKNKEIKAKIDQKIQFTTIQSLFPSAITVHTGIDTFAIYIEAN
ncbi:MAG: DegV family protein [Malacoplasma sp.]|nr:DegV family protein [Malacoplasma sp.]